MAVASSLPAGTVVARLSTDGATARQVGDLLAESFDAEEVAASAFEQPDGHWSLALHFSHHPDETAVRALIASVAGTATADTLVFDTLSPTDWVRKSLEGLTPVEAGRFVVHGAHHRAGVRANRTGIQIEAALAFGTGHHGTTRGCLLALDALVKARRRRRKAPGSPALRRRAGRKAGVLDIGTGTGVLAIAAARTLRRPVLASDIDPRAVAIARENTRINRAGASIEVIHAAGLGAAAFRSRAPYGLVFANILLEPLIQLATPISRLLAPGGYVVLSGLLTAQAGPALACYLARGLVLVRRIRLEGWATLVLSRPRRARRRT
jgi:ribosomal protein L11 methyltransferase